MAAQNVIKTFVQPAFPLVPGVCHLSPLDQYMVRIMIPIMFIFQTDPSADRDAIVESLQTGLSHTIHELNFLAADIVPESEDRKTIQLEYGDEPGVWFYESEVEGLSFETLSRRNFPFALLPADQFTPEPRWHDSKRSPALAVQVTFIDGGLVLGFCIHHSVVDGTGINVFLKVWAKHTDAASLGTPYERCVNESDLDMSNAFHPVLDRPLSDFYTYDADDAAKVSTEQAEVQAKMMELAMKGDYETLARINPQTHWHLSGAKMEELRKMASPPSADSPSVTDNAAIMAFVWMHLTRARELANPGRISSSSIVTSVNVRKRLDPPLPDDYPLNAIVLARATAGMSELTGPVTSQALYALAFRIVESIRYWTSDRISGLVGSIQKCPNVENTMIPRMGYDLLTTSPSNLADCVSKYTWGSDLGRAACLREAFPSFCDGVSMCLPSMRGGFEIQVWATTEAMDRLKTNEEWRVWMEPVL